MPIFLLFPFEGRGKIVLNIGSANVKKSVLAVSPFVLQDDSPTGFKLKLGKTLFANLNRNLKFSGYFKLLPPGAFIENPAKKAPLPREEDPKGFRRENWKLSGADFLLFNHYTVSEGRIQLKTALYNINSGKAVFKKNYTEAENRTKPLINRLSNDIVESLSGRKGVFETKIISVRSLSGTGGQKELFIMDWNGEGNRRLTFHRSIVLSPVWSPDGQKTAYTAFVYNKKLKRRQAVLFLYERATRVIQILSNRRGANLGADFFPDGRSLLVTLRAGRGLTDIFRLNPSRNRLKSLTNGPPGAITVDPAVHPKTSQIAFSSNKTGKAHIYTMNSSGGNVKQLTFVGHYNSTPDWSPFQNKLVFSGKDGGHFDIFLINADGTGLRRLTHLKKANGRRANCESPSFSPDGRFIVFTSDLTGTYQLYIMNLDDRSIERITFDRHNYKMPKWSPYL